MIGATLGRYRIIAKLGEGGMGSVWRAEDPALGRTVALKLLSSALWADDTARQRFLREARAASQLDHPNIATVYDVGESDGLAWIAYQFVDGETVAARTAAGPLPIAEAVVLAGETAQALAHAHARGVLHRDVTAGNVMVTREGHAMLVDFGLALPERGAHLTTTGTALGTVGYMAPEVMRGEPADSRSDLYGLGAVSYRMLTGRLPFEGGPPEAVMYRVLNERIPPPSEMRPDLAPSLERMVLRLLERDPADRYANATEVVEALREVAPERGPTALERARRTMARRYRRTSEALRRVGRIRVGVTALASIAILAAALWFAAQRGWLPGTAKEPQVIAVLPFKNTSVDPEEVAYLGEGLGDEMVLKLGQASGYRVLPWASTRGLGDSTRSLTALARELHVNLLLVGSFRAEGEQVHVTAALVDGRSGIQRWSQSFDDLLTDLMTVQANIATGVAAEIKGSLKPFEQQALARPPSKSAEAYALYLQGANYLQSGEFQTRSLAAPFFARATELDPNLAQAYVGRGAATMDQHFRGTSGGVASLLSAEQDFRSALVLDPALTRAQRGLVGAEAELGRPDEMLRIAAEASKKGDADVEGLLVRGWACMLSGLADTAVPLFEQVLKLDPSNQEAAWFRVVSLEWSGRDEQALEAGKAYVRRFGEDPELYLWMWFATASMGSDRQALLLLSRSLELFGDSNSNLYGTLYAACYLAERGQTGAVKTLTSHWIPILRDRLTMAPDNYRVLGVLVGLEGLAGDSASVRDHLGLYTRELRANKDLSVTGVENVIPAISRVGTLAMMEEIASAALSRDVGMLFNMSMPAYVRLTWPNGHSTSLMDSPAYQRLMNAIRMRNDELRRRYEAVVGLRSKSS